MKFNYTMHVEMWNCIAENDITPETYFTKKGFSIYDPKRPMRDSFACNYEWHKTAFSCFACPLVMSDCQKCGAKRDSGLYGRWRRETDKTIRKQLAIEIASLEVKDGVEYA